MIKEKRIDSIDFLRGLSILAVILLHIKIRLPFDTNGMEQFFSPAISKILFTSGYYGVMVFFVVSGFLITTSSIKRWGSIKDIRYDQFYLIRFARIMPCLIGLLFILSILDLAGIEGFVIDAQHTSLAHAIFSALTFHLNWLEAKTGYLPSSWDVLWSLSIEEAFYLFFPLICRGVKTETNFILLMLVFVIIGPFARTTFTNNDMWLDHSYFSCMDGIALGCIAALLTRKIKFSPASLGILMFSGVVLSLFIFVFRKQVYNLGLTSIGLNVTFLEISIALLLIPLYKKSLDKLSSKKWSVNSSMVRPK
jgi:peptidoglycan/LPS O-acetylase OafA/YrhL